VSSIIEPLGDDQPTPPDLAECDGGYQVAITVYFPGAIDGFDTDGLSVSTGEGLEDENRFLPALAAAIEAESEPCCLRLAYRTRYFRASARRNAELLAAILNGMGQTWANMPGVMKIHFHLIGFSAGGQVALNVASGLWPAYPSQVAMPPIVPSEVDVVTIATPLASSSNPLVHVVSKVVGFFAWLGRQLAKVFSPDNVFNASIGEDDYGKPVPSHLCRYVAIVTSSDFDHSPGAEENPCDDPVRLSDWKPLTLSMTQQDVDALPPDPANPVTPRHTIAPFAALQLHPGLMAPGCGCIPVGESGTGANWSASPCP
jgi:hypothetical protein